MSHKRQYVYNFFVRYRLLASENGFLKLANMFCNVGGPGAAFYANALLFRSVYSVKYIVNAMS